MQSNVRIGEVVAGFRIDGVVGEGATGSVYLAEEPRTGRRVALKVLAPELARDERFHRRFLRETELAASLDHPHVVATIASGEQDGTLYLAMEYVEGDDLRKLLRREGRLEPERALALVDQVAGALDTAHAAGLVHRDVKPGNIIVAPRESGEHAYVCDFGLARHVSSVSSLTSDRGFVGTIDYVPPEQIEGGTVDARADVYSLACVLFECLAGAAPFERDSELSVLFAHLNDPPPRLSELRPDLPDAFDGVFETALAKSPGDRFATCGELAAAARAALAGKAPPRRGRRRVLIAAIVAVAAAGAAVAGVALTRGSHGGTHRAVRAALPLRANALNLVDAGRSRVVDTVGYGTPLAPSAPAVDLELGRREGWLLLAGKQRLVRVDPATRKGTRVVKLPWTPGDRIASGGGMVWVTDADGGAVWGIDARTGKVARRLAFKGDSGTGIAYGAGSLWLARAPGIVRVDPRTGRIAARIPTPGQPGQTRWLVFADGAIWMVRADSGLVVKVDPATNVVTRRALLHGYASDLAVGGGFVWVSVVPDGKVYKLTEDALNVEDALEAGEDPERLAVGGGALWVANTAGKSIVRLDLASGRRTTLPTRGEPTTVVYHGGIVWAGVAPQPAPLPPVAGQELRVSTPSPGFDTDPAHAGGPVSSENLYLTCASLLGYPDSAGPAGRRLRPEIAAAMPTVSNGGRTYTFRIRSGFRFSPPSNAPVTAETFRSTIERTLAPSQQHGWPFGGDIAGVAAYSAGQARHISGIAVHGNLLSITLVRPAGDFLTRLSLFNFCPVPAGTPVDTSAPIPSAGPYYVASSTAERTVLLRNPNYGGDRPRRSARIVFTSYLPTPRAVVQVDRGAIDYLPPDFDNYSLLTPGGILDQRYGPDSAAARAGRERYFKEPMAAVDDLVFNTRRPLFRDERLRRAVEYALDRPALAKAFYDAPSDDVLPLGVPGHRARPLYPLDGPSLAIARRLAGGPGRRAVLYACPPEPRVTPIVRSNLARIGIAVSVVESTRCFQGSDPQRGRADLALAGLLLGPTDADPAPFFDMAVGGKYGYKTPGPGPWASPAFRARLARARALRGPRRIATYAKLRDELLRAAPLAVFGSWVVPQYFSPNVGCKVFQAEYHVVDLGLLCVRGR